MAIDRLLRIQEAADQVGLSRSTLHRLEREHLIHPRRNRAGQRVYTQADLETIRRITVPDGTVTSLEKGVKSS